MQNANTDTLKITKIRTTHVVNELSLSRSNVYSDKSLTTYVARIFVILNMESARENFLCEYARTFLGSKMGSLLHY